MPKVEDILGAEEIKQNETIGQPAEETLNANHGFNMSWLNIFKAQSIDRPVEEYTEHALNFDKKKSTGRIIRGLEGFLGALNYAIIDIVMGLVEKSREKKAGE